MVRYAQSRSKSDCGPIALLNALKWAGIRCILRRDYKKIFSKTRCNQDGMESGTFRKNFDAALRYFARGKFSVMRRFWRGIAVMEEFLRDPNHAVITLFIEIDAETKKRDVPHLMLITEVSKTGKAFLCVNPIDRNKAAAEWKSRKKIIDDHRPCMDPYGHPTPVLWFLIKKPKKRKRGKRSGMK